MSAVVRAGYKLTEIGVIPNDWDCVAFQALASPVRNAIVGGPFGSDLVSADYVDDGTPVIRGQNMSGSRYLLGPYVYVSHQKARALEANLARPGDVVFTQRGTMGQVSLVPPEPFEQYLVSQSQMKVTLKPSQATPDFFYCWFDSERGQRSIQLNTIQTGVPHINLGILRGLRVPCPPLPEQRAIATALSDVDALLTKLEALIAKKRDLKVATMQQLLTGQTRLPGFSGAWEVKRLGDITECLDNLRVPLNESQRDQMRGDYPYCGANGVLDFVNDYVLDDDVILVAEDGGYFDEYAYRPLAYRMVGKCWINNHAHILKAKAGYDQGLLFYLLVHKNIQSFLASGTRAKLNKSEMNKIEVKLSLDGHEQTAIATILSDMDTELTALEARRDKTRALKQGMMQVLLTGEIRLL